jgi:hypothetical protein
LFDAANAEKNKNGNESDIAGEKRERYTREASQRIVRADRAEAERLRRLGREVEAQAFEQSAAEAEKRAGP